jgi:hypothetical protein
MYVPRIFHIIVVFLLNIILFPFLRIKGKAIPVTGRGGP